MKLKEIHVNEILNFHESQQKQVVLPLIHLYEMLGILTYLERLNKFAYLGVFKTNNKKKPP